MAELSANHGFGEENGSFESKGAQSRASFESEGDDRDSQASDAGPASQIKQAVGDRKIKRSSSNDWMHVKTRIKDIGRQASDSDLRDMFTGLDKTNMLNSEDMLAYVEGKMEQRDAAIHAREHGVAATVGFAERVLVKVVLSLLVPALILAWVAVVFGICANTTAADAFTASFFGLVIMSSLSYLGCLFIIVSHFVHPDMWSERRQQMMLSSWPGLVHYTCILYEIYDQADGCNHTITLVHQTAFLMQMAWQIAVTHGVFRYIHLDQVALQGKDSGFRHVLCWGVPLLITGLLAATSASTLQDSVSGEKVLAPWCGLSGETDVRGVKAAFVHAPQMVGVVMYGFLYYYIASRNFKPDLPNDMSSARISTSPHQSLLHASQEKRMLDISRAAVTLRHCMSAFMMAYLLQTLLCVYAEHFDLQPGSAHVVYLVRIYLVTPQQFIYAAVFSKQRAGNIMGDLLQFHTATIASSSSGAKLADVNTIANKFILESVIKKGAKAAMKGRSGDAAQPELNPNLQSIGAIDINSKKPKSSKALTALARIDKTLMSSRNTLSMDSMIESEQYRAFKSTASLGSWKRLVQTGMFVPVSFFVWAPIQFMQANYSKKLGRILIGAMLYTALALFPFFFFQGTRDTDSEKALSTWLVDGHIGIVLIICIVGVWNNRGNPELVVVDNPRDTVRLGADGSRNYLGYMTLLIEFWQLPILAVSASHLTQRYSNRNDDSFSGSGAADEDAIDWKKVLIGWMLDNLFIVQYPMALIGVLVWSLVFSVSQAAAIVYRKPVEGFLKKAQLAIFVLSGPGYLFIIKNLMKPLFCIPVLDAMGEATDLLVVSAEKELTCWSERHLTYCTMSLFALCIFCPSATLTSAVKFSDGEDIRYVYLYLRLELLLKGSMVFLALANQKNELTALTFLIMGSCTITFIVYLMHPSNLRHINHLKYLIHACSIWMCLTCMWAIQTDNREWKVHVAGILVGWFCCVVVHIAVEIRADRQNFFKRVADDEMVNECNGEMTFLQDEIVAGDHICGQQFHWMTHAHILRLLEFAQHEHVLISRKSFETLAGLSYLDQMTKDEAFFAFAPSTAMEIMCSAISRSRDDGVRSFAIRTLKTFLQEERYAAETAVLLSGGMDIAEPIVAVINSSSSSLSPKLDAGICLLAMCGIDSNQLKWIVKLLPTLNEWMLTGPLVAQHLALELIAYLSSRFDFSEYIVANKSLSAMFELFSAIDEASSDGAAALKENKENGFRKGFKQPASFMNLAHQLPKSVIHDFSSQFANVPQFLVRTHSQQPLCVFACRCCIQAQLAVS